jgi:hypothetical protein
MYKEVWYLLVDYFILYRSNAITWEKDSSILIEDGYEWRKYGQKKIMKAKYLRCISSTSILYLFYIFVSNETRTNTDTGHDTYISTLIYNLRK